MHVYVITHAQSGKQYVGQTVTPVEARWRRHCYNARHGTNRMAITLAIAKHGVDAFNVACVETCVSVSQLNEAEQRWISKLNSMSPYGYNLTSGGKLRGHLSQETKAKISASNTGKRRSEETRRALSESHVGKLHTQATKEKLRIAFAGKQQDLETVRKRTEKLAKTYTLKSPEGESVTVTNMKSFCRDHNLSASKMSEVVNGKTRQHKGWQICA